MLDLTAPFNRSSPSDPPADASASVAAVRTAFRGPPQRLLDVGHSRLAHWRFGSGPDLVFVHGWPLHAATFRAVVPLLADAFTCHLLDLPGAGQSSASAHAPINFGAHAVTLRHAIEVLGLRRYAFVAHDSGGVVARRAAADNPQVAALVLSGTEISGHRPWLVRLLVAASRLPLGSQIVRAILKSRTLRRSPLGFRAAFADLAHIDGDFHELFVAPICASNAAMARQLEHMRTVDWAWIRSLPDTHAKIAAPTQLIWGTDDGFFPVDRARRMAAEFRGGACFSEIAGARAFLHEEHPRAFVEHARPFLSKAFAAQVTR